MNGLGRCTRCGSCSVEHLRTHSHCWECGYSPEGDSELTQWHRLEFGANARSAKARSKEDLAHYGSNHPSTFSHDFLANPGIIC